MHTIIHRQNQNRFPSAEPEQGFRAPHYDCLDLPSALKLVVYVPGVDASGVELTTQGPDIFVTARKTHHIRVNWQSLHLESAQLDYQLKLRLGQGLDLEALQASVTRGVLTIVLPKSRPASVRPAERPRQVA